MRCEEPFNCRCAASGPDCYGVPVFKKPKASPVNVQAADLWAVVQLHEAKAWTLDRCRVFLLTMSFSWTGEQMIQLRKDVMLSCKIFW